MRMLIENGYVVSMNEERAVYDGGFVAVDEAGRIAAVGAAADVPAGPFDERLNATGMIVVPGLLNLHQHHWYNLFKGLAAGMLLEEWVSGLLLPCAAELTADDLRGLRPIWRRSRCCAPARPAVSTTR